jgi:hypothetical protein
MEICLEIMLISLSILLIAKAANEAMELAIYIHSSDLVFRRNKEELSSVEEPAEETPVKLRYDVDGFKSRMAKIRDMDGLYDIAPTPPITDFTGTEVVTDNYEIEADRLIGR